MDGEERLRQDDLRHERPEGARVERVAISVRADPPTRADFLSHFLWTPPCASTASPSRGHYTRRKRGDRRKVEPFTCRSDAGNPRSAGARSDSGASEGRFGVLPRL